MPLYAEAPTLTEALPVPLLGVQVTHESAALTVHEVLEVMLMVAPEPLELTKTEDTLMLSLADSPLCETLTLVLEAPYVKVRVPVRVEAELFLAAVTVSV